MIVTSLMLGFVMVLIILMVIPAYAVSSLNGLGITIDKPLLISGKLNYSDIIFYDNSTQKQVGSFVKKNGDYIRQYTPKQNNPEWLRFHNFTILVDPPSKFPDRIKMIYIVSNLDEFHTKSQRSVTELKPANSDNFTKAQQSQRLYTKDRYVDSCRIAIITAKNWQVLLPDTINYLSHDCQDSFTKIHTNMTDIKPITKHDIATSSKYKQDSYYDYVKKNCSQKRNACTDINNRAVTTMRDTK